MPPALSLEISGADRPTQSVVLPEGTTVLGRAATSSILLDDPMVSRRHAEIRTTPTGAEIADMGSANGTLLNNMELPIKEWRPLRSGDKVEVGPFFLELKSGSNGNAGMETALLQQGTVLISAAAPPHLLIRTSSGGAQDIKLTEPSYTLGRSPENDIVVNDPAVSRHHARLDKNGSSYEITDLGSTNGLAVNGSLLERKQLVQGDTLQISKAVELEFRATETAGAAPSIAPIDLNSGQEVVLGRGGNSDVAEILNPQVSRVHARIVYENGRLVIEDAGSEGGTFVNGDRVQRQVINEGDEIRLGGQALRLINGQLQAQTDADLTLDAVNLRRVVDNGRTILQDVNLSVSSREFVAIVGPSGAGKSTLITALCGYVQATSGNVLINGNDFYSHLEAYRNDIGYVPQDDIIHRELNINRAFAYAAKLRMPEDTRPYEREQRCRDVLEELALTQYSQTAVRQLSGGQRKRVSIGVELLTGPSLLFLDEATTGLDPGIETQMMKLFRHLADNGRIVVLVTHATKNVMICDKVAFMAKGGYLAFFGPPEEALTYFDTKDFDEIYLRLEEKSGEEWGRLFEVHTRRQGNGARPVRNVHQQTGSTMSMRETKPSRNPIKQFMTLTSRSLETLMRSPKDIATLLVLAPFLGALDFLIWKRQTFSLTVGDSNDALTMFFMLSIVTLLVGSLGSVREIVKESAIYKREHMVCIQVLPYIASKVFIGMLFALYSAGMLFVFQVLSVDFSYLDASEFAQLFVPVFLATFSGVMLGLLVSAISPSEERAMLLIIAVIIPQFLLSGALVPINAGAAGPILTAPATAKWSWGSMLTTAKAKTGNCDTGQADPPRAPNVKDCKIPGINAPDLKTDADKVSLIRSLDRYGNVFAVDLVEYWGAMVGIILVVLVLVVVVQKRKDAD